VAYSTNIAWSHDVDEIFGTHTAMPLRGLGAAPRAHRPGRLPPCRDHQPISSALDLLYSHAAQMRKKGSKLHYPGAAAVKKCGWQTETAARLLGR
jgi:hypothetical protein